MFKSCFKKAELSSYGKRGKVLGPVVGAYGEMSDDVYVIAEAVAEELATEHAASTLTRSRAR